MTLLLAKAPWTSRVASLGFANDGDLCDEPDVTCTAVRSGDPLTFRRQQRSWDVAPPQKLDEREAPDVRGIGCGPQPAVGREA